MSMIGKSLSHYQITGLIGKGDMTTRIAIKSMDEQGDSSEQLHVFETQERYP